MVAFISSHSSSRWSYYVFHNPKWPSKRSNSAFCRRLISRVLQVCGSEVCAPYFLNSFASSSKMSGLVVSLKKLSHSVCLCLPIGAGASCTGHCVWHVAFLSSVEPPRWLPATSSVCVTAPSAHFNYASLPSCTCSLSIVRQLTQMYLSSGKIVDDRVWTWSVSDGVMLLTSLVLRRVVLNQVSTTLPILGFVTTHLPSLFCWLLLLNRCCCSLSVRSSSVRPVLFNARSNLLLSSLWLVLLPLSVRRSILYFATFLLIVWRRSYSWVIYLLWSLSVCFWDINIFCNNKMASPEQNTLHVLLYIVLTQAVFHIVICTLYLPWTGARIWIHLVVNGIVGVRNHQTTAIFLLLFSIFCSIAQSEVMWPTDTFWTCLLLSCKR